MPLLDDINRVLRDFERYTGDGLPGAPLGAPLPTGDPTSGRRNIPLHELRELLKAIAQALGDPSALGDLIDEIGSKASQDDLDGLTNEVRNGRVHVLPAGTPTGKTLPLGTDGILTATGGGSQFWVPTSRPVNGTPESDTLQRDASDQWWARALDSREIAAGDAAEAVARANADAAEAKLRGDADATEAAARVTADDALSTRITALRAETVPTRNQVPFGTFVGGDPWLRTPARIVGLTQPEVAGKVYPRGVQWPVGQTQFAIWRSLAEGVLGKYVFGAVVIVSSNPANLPAAAAIYQEDAAGTLTGLTTPVTGYVDIAPTIRLVWRTGRAQASGTRNTMVGAAEAPVDDTRFATGFYLLTSDTPFDAETTVQQIVADQKRLAGLSALTAKAIPGVGRFVYQGSGDVDSFVTGYLDGSTITRVFRADPVPDALRPVLNFLRDEVNGVVVRNVTDDVAPQRVWGTTLGANHGWAATTVTANGHGKTVASQGGIYANGGKQWMLMRVVNANTLVLTEVNGNGSAAAGAYTHVNGPGPTGSFTASAPSVGQWYPSIQNRRLKAIVDGADVGYGDHPFRDRVQLRETYEVAAKADLLTWWGANGRVASPAPNATAAYAVTNTYAFDREGQVTIHTEITALANVQVNDLMFLQAQRAGASDYYIPKTVPFTQGGRSLDYANIEPADLTSTGGLASVFITPDRMAGTGLAPDRVVALFGQQYVFATGFVPVLQAAADQRRANVSVKALELRGGTDKLYMAGVDRGDFTAARGDSFAVVGYRNIGPKPALKTAAYTVRVGQTAYVYADWHDDTLTDRIDIPAELVGRPFELVESRNAQVLSNSASGSVLVGVTAAGGYGFVILKF